MWKLTYKWASTATREKSNTLDIGRYFGKFNKFRNDQWVFGDRDTSAYLLKFAWTKIVRHQMVKGRRPPMTRP